MIGINRHNIRWSTYLRSYLVKDPLSDFLSVTEPDSLRLSDILDRTRVNFCCSSSAPIVDSSCCLISRKSASEPSSTCTVSNSSCDF